MGVWHDETDKDPASISLYTIASHKDANFSELKLVIFGHDGVVVVVVEEHDVWPVLEAVAAVVDAFALSCCDYVSVVSGDGWHLLGYNLINLFGCRLLR